MQQFLIANTQYLFLCGCSLYIAYLGEYDSKFRVYIFSFISNIIHYAFSPPYPCIKLQYFNLGEEAFYVK